MKYVCIGVPFWLGEEQENSAVRAIEESGLAQKLGAAWVNVIPNYAVYDHPVVAVNRALADAINAHPDTTPLIFAADCTSVWGAMKGLASKQPAVIWYDAHGDFNTPETTISGFLGGMPLAGLVGRGNEDLINAIGVPLTAESDVLLSDARDLDPAERDLLKQSEVRHLTDVDELLTVELPHKPVYIHFDVDVVDSREMPALSYPVEGGPSLEQAKATLLRLRRDATITGVLFSLWNHSKSDAKMALDHTLNLVDALTQ